MSNKEVAVSVKNIHKNFVLPQHKNTSLKQAAVNIVRKNGITTQKVLDGVSFDIYKGEFFGIVGRNGSGKSTLLKLMAGVYTPTGGSIEINGGLTPFIELGVGFNAELSGRDNVFLNGALLGYTRKQMEPMYDEIVEFAELEEHMDKKLKNYSSGMQVRLAFSIAIKAKNDILIFDEVLAVGDEAFQRKCMDVFYNYRRSDQTVILVTHSMDTVVQLCTRGLMLEDGKITTIGSVEKVAEAYQRSNDEDEKARVVKEDKTPVQRSLKVSGIKQRYAAGDTLKVTLTWPEKYDVRWAGIAVIGENNEYIFGSDAGKDLFHGQSAEHSVVLNLFPGKYYLTATVKNTDLENIEVANKLAQFTIR
jgi:ABC-2 type transport system ATP-binding protein